MFSCVCQVSSQTNVWTCSILHCIDFMATPCPMNFHSSEKTVFMSFNHRCIFSSQCEMSNYAKLVSTSIRSIHHRQFSAWNWPKATENSNYNLYIEQKLLTPLPFTELPFCPVISPRSHVKKLQEANVMSHSANLPKSAKTNCFFYSGTCPKDISNDAFRKNSVFFWDINRSRGTNWSFQTEPLCSMHSVICQVWDVVFFMPCTAIFVWKWIQACSILSVKVLTSLWDALDVQAWSLCRWILD